MSPQSQNEPEINNELDGGNSTNQDRQSVAPKTLKLVTEFGSVLGEDSLTDSSGSSSGGEEKKNDARQVPSEIVEKLETKEDNSLAPLTPTQKESGVVSQPILLDKKKYEQEIEALRQLLFGSEVANLRQENQELHRKINQLEERLNNPEQLKHLLAPVILDALRKEATSSSQGNTNNGTRKNRVKSSSQASSLKSSNPQQNNRKKTISAAQNNGSQAANLDDFDKLQNRSQNQHPPKHKSTAKSSLNRLQEVRETNTYNPQNQSAKPDDFDGIGTPQNQLSQTKKNKAPQSLNIPQEVREQNLSTTQDKISQPHNLDDFDKPQNLSRNQHQFIHKSKVKPPQGFIPLPQTNAIQPHQKSKIESEKNKLSSQPIEIQKSNLDNQPVNQLPPEETKTQASGKVSKKKRSLPIFPLIIISLLALGGSVFLLWRMYTESLLERKIHLAFDSNPNLAVYNLRADVKGENLVLTGILPNTILRNQAEEFTNSIVNNKEIYNNVIVVEPSSAQVATQVEKILAMFNQIEGINLEAKVENRKVTVEGIAVQLSDLNSITEAFGEIPGVKRVDNKVTNQPSSIATRVYFGKNSAELALQDAGIKILPIKELMLQYPTLKLRIVGHTHESEGGNDAQKLALERAQAVQLVLEDQGIDRRRTEALGVPGSPDNITPNQPTWLSSCVLFEIIK